MERYSGQSLSACPHVVVLGSCKVGNFVVSTPMLRGLRSRFPDAIIGFIGSELTADFEEAHPCIDWRLSWDDPNPGSCLQLLQQIQGMIGCHGPVQLAVNLDGFNPYTCSLVPSLVPKYVAGGSLSRDRRRNLPWGELPQQRFLADDDWDSDEFLSRYRNDFNSNYIAELFCQLAYVAEFVDPTQIEIPSVDPPFHVPELLIHCTTARPAKMWSFANWKRVVDAASSMGWSVGLIGGPPSLQRQIYNSGDDEDWLLSHSELIDLRGQTSLIELAGACARARAVISVDAGPVHIASAVGVPTLAIVGNDECGTGASPIRLWLPRVTNFSRTISSETCSTCVQNRFRNDMCLVDGHPCMQAVNPMDVILWLQHVHRSVPSASV